MRLTTHGTDSGFEPFHGTRRMTNATSGRDSSTVTKGMTHHQRPAEDVDAQLRKNSAPAGVCSRLCDGEARNSGLPIRQGLCVHIDPCAKPTAPTSTTKPAPQTSPAKAAAPAAGSPPVGTLLQVMRGILFHSSNLIFATQSEDPADPKMPLPASFGTFARVYTGWPVVENAAVTLAESADLLLKPGRLCSNGLPVPVDRADYRKFVQGLRVAGQAALKAAQSKNMDNMIEVSGTVSEACENCHSVYRDKPDLKSRCLP
jgi:hypothetical protein